MRISKGFFLAAVLVPGWAGLICAAQQLPVALTLHITGRSGAPVANATIGIAFVQDSPFFHYRSDASGNVTLALAPGAHDLRVEVRGYPVASEHIDLSAPTTLHVALGKAPASPASPVQPAPSAPEPAANPAPENPSSPAPAVAPMSGGASASSTANAAGPASSKRATSRAAKAAPPAKSTAASRRKSAAASAVSPPSNPLQSWTSCFFPDGLQIQAVDPLAPGVTSRDVDTAQGTQQINLVAGERVMFAYPFTDFFANAKAEVLPADEYAQEKQTLLANHAYLESERNGPEEARSLPPNLHGFEVHGNNLRELRGSALGMYLIFDDSAHVVTTVYFLNQDSWRRKFQSFEEYERLRDRFLTTYTGCVRSNEALPH